MSVSDVYIPRIGPHISSSRKGRPIAGIYNSLIDTWMWKLGLRPRYSFSGNICFKFSAFCLCSARCIHQETFVPSIYTLAEPALPTAPSPRFNHESYFGLCCWEQKLEVHTTPWLQWPQRRGRISSLTRSQTLSPQLPPEPTWTEITTCLIMESPEINIHLDLFKKENPTHIACSQQE